jgi:hypothetical protein
MTRPVVATSARTGGVEGGARTTGHLTGVKWHSAMLRTPVTASAFSTWRHIGELSAKATNVIAPEFPSARHAVHLEWMATEAQS